MHFIRITQFTKIYCLEILLEHVIVIRQICILNNSLFTQLTKIYCLEILQEHVIVIRQICILNVQHVKDNFETRKHYNLKLSTRKLIILNFQLLKSDWQLVK